MENRLTKRFEAWLERPGLVRASTGVGAAIALVLGYLGATWYLDRTPFRGIQAQAVEAAEVAPGAPRPTLPTPSGPIVVHGTGDVLLDPTQLGALAQGYDAPWAGVRDLFRKDDLTVINLECSPGEGGVAEDKEFTFRCPKGFHAMRASGVDVANLGNNHAGDFGKQALLRGHAALTRADVAPVGAGRDAGEANRPATFELRGKRVAVLGFGGVVPTPRWFATDDGPGVADGYDTEEMVRAVRAADETADIVIVTLHWGAELDTRPRDDDVQRAHAMIDAGADAIFGHHAHVLQPMDVYEGRPIFYGLGNFIWPKGGPTAVARVTFAPDGSVSGCLLPATISGGRPKLDQGVSC